MCAMDKARPSPEDMLLGILYYARENCGLQSIPDSVVLLEHVLADYALSHSPLLDVFEFKTKGVFAESTILRKAYAELLRRGSLIIDGKETRLATNAEEAAKRAAAACCPFCVWEISLHLSKCLGSGFNLS